MVQNFEESPSHFATRRFRRVIWVTCIAFLVVIVRAVLLTLAPTHAADSPKTLDKLAKNQYQQNITLAPYRGPIFDRRGDALAISIRKPSLAINPRVFSPSKAQIRRLARILRIDRTRIEKASHRKSYFAWLARQISFAQADSIRTLGLKGLFEVREPSRFYPSGEAASHLVGMVGLDNKGLLGLESFYDRDLRGTPLSLNLSRDGLQRTLFRESSGTAPEKSGNRLHLTIDRVIQEIAYEELSEGVKAAGATGGFAIVTDPHTGRILALTSVPTYEPNRLRLDNMGATRNRALNDVFEPGSVTKPFVIGRALDHGKVRLHSTFDCENGRMRLGGRVIHDTHPADHLSVAETLVQSSNICTYKIADKLGAKETEHALRDFGFGTGELRLGLTGEGRGYLKSSKSWRKIRFANIAFGQGFTVTGLELVTAMGAIANGGQLMRPSLVEKIISPDNMVLKGHNPAPLRRVLTPTTARQIRQVLRQVVEDEEGTGENARTTKYTTAGKTGTAQKVDPTTRGYSPDNYLVSFLGFAPTRDPHLVVYVVVDEPTVKPYYGGTWAAPIFSRIVSRSLRYLNVAPDKSDVAKVVGDQPGAKL